MIPHSKQELYLKFISGQNTNGPTIRVERGPLAQNLFSTMPKFVEILASNGNNIIIDEVLFDTQFLRNYANSLKHYKVYYIGVFCDLKIMQEREILRGDRSIGLSNDQIGKVHQGMLGTYDLKVDTTKLLPFEVASQILLFLNDNPVPRAFQELISSDQL